MLHTHTIAITLAVLMITAIVVHGFNWWVHRPLRGPGWWVLGMTANAVGMTLIVLRERIPDLLSIVGGSAVLLTGLLTMLTGLRAFAGERLDWRIPVLFVGALLANQSYFTLVENSLAYRWLGMAVLMVATKSLALGVIWRIGRRDGYSGVLLLALSYTAEILFYLAHLRATFHYEPQVAKLFDASILQPLGVLGIMVLLMTNTFGFILLTANRSRAELNRLALMDSLTGLANRRAFDARLESQVAAAKRGGTPLSLLLFDLDHFKSLNDAYGHQGGDEILKFVAALGASLVRCNDDFARLGGEEFALLAAGTGLDEAVAIGERMRAMLETRQVDFAGQHLRVTASVGVATLGQDGAEAAALVRAADLALYKAKNAGRNCVMTYTPEGDAVGMLVGS